MRKSVGYLICIITVVLFIISMNWILIIKSDELPKIDQWSRPFVETVDGTTVYTIFRWMTEFGSVHFVLPLSIITLIILWVVFRDYLPALTFGLGVLFAHLLNQSIKSIVARERPSISPLLNAEGFSFPSGHAMVPIVCYGLIAFFISKKLRSTWAMMVVYGFFGCFIWLIGISRYILNVHYLTDIISGFLFGLFVFLLSIYLYEKIQVIRSEKRSSD